MFEDQEWICSRCGLKYFHSEPVEEMLPQEVCYSCWEDLVDEAEERRIQRILVQQEY